MDMFTKLKKLSAQMDDPRFMDALSLRFEKFRKGRGHN